MRWDGWSSPAVENKKIAIALSSMGIDAPRLDYADAQSITETLAYITNRTDGTLDAVFNNGAFAVPGAVEDLPTDALRSIYETNVFGYHEVMRQVLPIMRAQGSWTHTKLFVSFGVCCDAVAWCL